MLRSNNFDLKSSRKPRRCGPLLPLNARACSCQRPTDARIRSIGTRTHNASNRFELPGSGHRSLLRSGHRLTCEPSCCSPTRCRSLFCGNRSGAASNRDRPQMIAVNCFATPAVPRVLSLWWTGSEHFHLLHQKSISVNECRTVFGCSTRQIHRIGCRTSINALLNRIARRHGTSYLLIAEMVLSSG